MGRLGARAVIEHEGKYLLVRNKVSEHFWCLPGGGVEPGEDIISALERELVEELGVKPVVGNLLYVHTLKGPDGYDAPAFFFHVKNGADYTSIDLTKTTHGELEIAEATFIDVTSHHELPSFLKTELQELKANNYNCPARIRLTEMEE